MFCRISQDRMSPLPERLRALPAFNSPPGGWQRVESRLNARRRRFVAAGGGLALAASVLVAVGLVSLRPESAPPAVTIASSQSSPAVVQLITRSQALERELSSARPQVAVWNTGRDTRATLLEQELRRVDARLTFADAQSAESLWRRRVKLMNALVELHEPGAPALQYASYQY